MEMFTHGLLKNIEASLTIPTQGYFHRNEEGIRLSYQVGSKSHSVTLPTRLEAMNVLIENGYADKVEYHNGQPELYTKHQKAISGHRGRLEWKVFFVHQPWEKLELNPAQVQTIIARIKWNELPVTDKVFKIMKRA